jgi:hypothetical protein
MSAAVDLLTELGVPPRVSAASRDWLEEIASRNRPEEMGGTHG